MIKHLVISGGGPTGFLTYGAARYLAQQSIWNIVNTKSIYGTSIGAFLGVVLALNLPWDYLDDYFIETKWDKILNLRPNNFIDAYSSKGIVQPDFIRDSFEPLFYEKEIDLDVNLKEFYELNNIDLHIFTTDMNSQKFEKIDLSHKTHPELKLIKAIEMSTAYPILFKPIFDENDEHCYIDGGLLNNLPLNDCIEQKKCNLDEILVFKNCWVDNNMKIHQYSSIIDYFLVFFLKLVEQVDTEKNQIIVPNTVNFSMNDIDNFKKGRYNYWLKSINDKENRKFLIDQGEYFSKKLIKNFKNK
jgi:predicted acylesterase/phospholipase RssA